MRHPASNKERPGGRLQLLEGVAVFGLHESLIEFVLKILVRHYQKGHCPMPPMLDNYVFRVSLLAGP